MPLPILLAATYLVANLALMIWLERERVHGRRPAPRIAATSTALRYGPPLAGAVYLVVLSGDWLFVLFVSLFFAGAFWMLNGLLAYTNYGPGGPGGDGNLADDATADRRSRTDRDGS